MKKGINTIIVFAFIISVTMLLINSFLFKDEESDQANLSESLFTIEEGETGNLNAKETVEDSLTIINDNSQLLYSDKDFEYFITPSLFTITTTDEVKGMTIKNHDYDKAVVEDYYTIIEPFDLTDEISGVIAEDESRGEFHVFQLNADDNDSGMQVTLEKADDVDQAKKALSSLNHPEEKTLDKADLEKQVDLNFADINIPDLEEINLQIDGMTFRAGEFTKEVSVHYSLRGDKNDLSFFYAIYPEDAAPTMRGESVTSEQGQEVIIEDSHQPIYTWKKAGNVYRMTISDPDDTYTEDD